MKIQSQHPWKQGAAKKRMYTSDIHGRYLTFTFTVDAMPGYTKFNKTKRVLAAIQIIEDVVAESDEHRLPCNGESDYLITWESTASPAPTVVVKYGDVQSVEQRVEIPIDKNATVTISGVWSGFGSSVSGDTTIINVTAGEDAIFELNNATTGDTFVLHIYASGQEPI